MDSTAESGTHNGPLPSALSRSFRGKFCDVILRNRSVITFEKDQVVYDVGDENPTFFFLQKGFVKIGGITEDGLELIYDGVTTESSQFHKRVGDCGPWLESLSGLKTAALRLVDARSSSGSFRAPARRVRADLPPR